jgi:hypothetical protein
VHATQYYIALIREETTRAINEYSLHERLQLQNLGCQTSGYWGYFWLEVNYPVGPYFDTITLNEANKHEWAAIDRILRAAVHNYPQQPYC